MVIVPVRVVCAICESRWTLQLSVAPDGWICVNCRAASYQITRELHRIVQLHYEPKRRWGL